MSSAALPGVKWAMVLYQGTARFVGRCDVRRSCDAKFLAWAAWLRLCLCTKCRHFQPFHTGLPTVVPLLTIGKLARFDVQPRCSSNMRKRLQLTASDGWSTRRIIDLSSWNLAAEVARFQGGRHRLATLALCSLRSGGLDWVYFCTARMVSVSPKPKPKIR